VNCLQKKIVIVMAQSSRSDEALGLLEVAGGFLSFAQHRSRLNADAAPRMSKRLFRGKLPKDDSVPGGLWEPRGEV
jgi:hypothetical protein